MAENNQILFLFSSTEITRRSSERLKKSRLHQVRERGDSTLSTAHTYSIQPSIDPFLVDGNKLCFIFSIQSYINSFLMVDEILNFRLVACYALTRNKSILISMRCADDRKSNLPCSTTKLMQAIPRATCIYVSILL